MARFSFSPLLLLSLLIASAQADLSTSPSQDLRSFMIDYIKAKGYYCTYTVEIKTSCYSPRYTSDAVSLVFGDFYRNEVYVARLDDPSTYTFESCSTDTFDLSGPCGYGVCYLYLYRSGYDGWVPESIKVYESSGRVTKFYYDVALPNGVWYGFDECNSGSVSGGSWVLSVGLVVFVFVVWVL